MKSKLMSLWSRKAGIMDTQTLTIDETRAAFRLTETFVVIGKQNQTICSVVTLFDGGERISPNCLQAVYRHKQNVGLCKYKLCMLVRNTKHGNACWVDIIYLILYDWLCWGLTTRQPLWIILCRLPEKGRKEIEEIVEEMKEGGKEERGTGMKVKKQKK